MNCGLNVSFLVVLSLLILILISIAQFWNMSIGMIKKYGAGGVIFEVFSD